MTVNNDTDRFSDDNALVCEIVAAYVSNNHLSLGDVPSLITSVRIALSAPLEPAKTEETDAVPHLPTPAQVRKSITPDALISFVDGKPYKTLKRHLTASGFDPDTYRKHFGLPSDYPMTAPSYSKKRSELAKSTGLGAANTPPVKVQPPAPAGKARQKRS